MKPGDTVVVSAAAGSVGQIAGQIARLGGARAVGITSSPGKIAWCRELGYAEAIDYRAEPDLRAAVAKGCPQGADVFIDNTGGPLHDAVMQNLAMRARVVVVGSISLAGKFGQPDIGLRFQRQILIARATIRGFLVSDYPYQAEARNRIRRLVSRRTAEVAVRHRQRHREHAGGVPAAAHEPQSRQAAGADRRRAGITFYVSPHAA